MNNSKQAWERLVAAARRAPGGRDVEMPHGFATRVAALGMAAEPSGASLALRLSLRAMIVAGSLAVLAVAANLSSISHPFQDETLPSDDPVAALVDLAS